ncbi:RCC1/BLIP-II [Mytilinidion resinicola]|uniref:RCC1/BLIP-II n=1 Tax=Mytilinidion resinicola TaxID=574789 RepID=A0A6A6YJJ0_9PEZI|nr:RCC1/BLIP-II [Mytilinidion resinicola]KAF2808718.1 RCC1/BLIP-II [Mytilinidion resinicola]
MPTQLEAGATFFTLLLDNGEVFTWGDPRYPQCLGRTVDDDAPATTPTRVPYIEGIRIKKIGSGGWMSGALGSELDGGELYIWGRSEPGFESKISALSKEDDDTHVHVVEVRIDGMEADVVNFGIGAGHLIVAASSDTNNSEVRRAVLACGQGDFGQLGIGKRADFVEKLTEIPCLRGSVVCNVACGSKTSFVVVKKQEATSELHDEGRRLDGA